MAVECWNQMKKEVKNTIDKKIHMLECADDSAVEFNKKNDVEKVNL